MMDLSVKGLGSEDMDGKYPDGASSEESQTTECKKSCSDCRTTKTPLWRGGPAGPKSLCNACGIRYRKKRRALLGLNRGGPEKEKKERARSSSGNNKKLGASLNLGLLGLGREVMLQRSVVKKPRSKLGEEEQAAVLLMALSCGSVYA